MSGTTVGDAVDECLNSYLLGTFSTQLNATRVGVAPGDLEVSCQFPLTGIGVGTFVAIDDELLYVVDTDQTTNRIVVDRGARGTTPAAHVAGTDIDVNPRFPRFLVREMMHKDLLSWPDSLYRMESFQATVGTTENTFEIPASVNGFVPTQILRVRRLSLSNSDERYRRTLGYEYDMDLRTVSLNECGGLNRTFQVRVGCAFNADALDDDDNDLTEDVGLTSGMVEILELGAAYRLLMGRGSSRLFPESQGQSRSAQEVGTTDIPRLASLLLNQKMNRMGEEAAKLTRLNSFGGT